MQSSVKVLPRQSDIELIRFDVDSDFSLIEENIILEALKTTVSLEANRLATNDFVNELKEILIKKVKENLSFKESQREYMKMYDVVCDMESLLITNINLSLFFTSLTSRLMSIKN